MIIDPADLDAAQSYKLLIGTILPRPIAWVSTRSVGGVDNLAPVSFFTAAGRKPPRIHLSLQTRSDGVTLKDTFVNIRLAAEYTLVDNAFTTPVDDSVLTAYDGRRMKRLDDHPDGFSPIDTDAWSPSGATRS